MLTARRRGPQTTTPFAAEEARLAVAEGPDHPALSATDEPATAPAADSGPPAPPSSAMDAALTAEAADPKSKAHMLAPRLLSYLMGPAAFAVLLILRRLGL